MNLKEVRKKYGGHTERLPENEIKSGKEVSLVELTKALDKWKKVYDQLNPQTVDQRRHDEQRQLQQELGNCSRILRNMTFRIEVLEGYSKQFTYMQIAREHPDNARADNIIREHLRPDGWWFLIACIKGRDGKQHLDFCHANTREIFRISVSANSSIADHFNVADPAEPHGSVIIF